MENKKTGQQRPIASLVLATATFLVVFQFMPDIWLKLAQSAKTSSVPRWVFDVLGTIGISALVYGLIALKSDMFGSNHPDKNPYFISVSAFGALMHLLSFVHYYNEFGITLDTLFFLGGIAGLISRKYMPEEHKRYVAIPSSPSWGKFFGVTTLVLILVFILVHNRWQNVIDFMRPLPDAPFLWCGWIAGILILSGFLGQNFGWLRHTSITFAVIYLGGCFCYLLNLTLEPNPYTVALEITLFLFYFKRIKK